MNIKVNFCGNCPFLYSDFNPDSSGYSTIDICLLARFLRQIPDYISVHDNCGSNPNAKTPGWCPLNKANFEIEFQEFSIERKQEIQKISNEIDELEDFMNNFDSYEEPDYIAKSEQLQNAYTKLQELQSNESN